VLLIATVYTFATAAANKVCYISDMTKTDDINIEMNKNLRLKSPMLVYQHNPSNSCTPTSCFHLPVLLLPTFLKPWGDECADFLRD